MEEMVSEKIYILDDDTKMVVLGNVIFNEIRYLLLNEDNSDKYSVAYEETGDLVFVDENDPNYSKILNLLFNELNKNI